MYEKPLAFVRKDAEASRVSGHEEEKLGAERLGWPRGECSQVVDVCGAAYGEDCAEHPYDGIVGHVPAERRGGAAHT